jgi:hypothetical protein
MGDNFARRLALASISLALVSGCGSQGSSPDVPAKLQQTRHSAAATSGPLIYVANWSWVNGHARRPALLGFAIDATGNVPPVVRIRGENSGIGVIDTSAGVDNGGRLYIAGPYLCTIGVWPAGSNGDAALAAYFNVDCDSFSHEPIVFTFDARGHLWVASYEGQDPDMSAIYEFPPVPANATGHINLKPIRQIFGSRTGLQEVSAIALDGRGGVSVEEPGSSVLTFADTANGNVAPISRIQGGKTQLNGYSNTESGYGGIRYDSQGRLVACSDSSRPSLVTFAPGAHGNVAPVRTLLVPGCLGFALDANDNIYVSYFNSIFVYAAGSVGSTQPVRTITGPLTTLGVSSSATL